MQQHKKLTPNMGEPLTNLTHYHGLVGALVYLIIIKPDIAYYLHYVILFTSHIGALCCSSLDHSLFARHNYQGTLFSIFLHLKALSLLLY